MESRKEAFIWPPVPGRDGSGGETSPDLFEKKMIDFLEGRTRGEDLFHALYDRVLDEPIPERMRALFKKWENGASSP